MKCNSVLFGILGVIRYFHAPDLLSPDYRVVKSLVLAHFVLVNTSGRVDSLDSADRKLALERTVIMKVENFLRFPQNLKLSSANAFKFGNI